LRSALSVTLSLRLRLRASKVQDCGSFVDEEESGMVRLSALALGFLPVA
jgi:hypothetical protein